jgi:ferritin
MISTTMQNLLNDQIQKEFYSAYLYLSMKAWFAEQNLDGFANFFDVQVKEERDHAMKFYAYVVHVGGKVELQAIPAPPTSFASALSVFQDSLKHEQFVTASIYNLVNLAIEEKDHKTNSFLQWFVTEQAEEEATAESNVRKLQLIGDNTQGLFMHDAELAKRVYIPPVPPV